MTESPVCIRLSDLNNPCHARAIRELTNHYAMQPTGQGQPLAPDVLDRLIPGLQALPTTRIFLAWMGDSAVGIATCFVGFSTFQGKPLINVHDLAVCREHQGKGIGRKLLAAVREYATLHGMGAITLEVLQGNTRARELYNSLGFRELADPLPSEFFLFGKAKLA